MKRLLVICAAVAVAACVPHGQGHAAKPKQPQSDSALHGPARTGPRPMLVLACMIENDPDNSGSLRCAADDDKPEGGGGGGGVISCNDNTDAENQEVAASTCSITDPGSSSPSVTVGPGSPWGNIPHCDSLTEVTGSTNCISEEPDTSAARGGDDVCALQLNGNLRLCAASGDGKPLVPGGGASMPVIPGGSRAAAKSDCIERANKTFEMCEKQISTGNEEEPPGSEEAPGSEEPHGAESKRVRVGANAGRPDTRCNEILRINFQYCSRFNNPRGEALCKKTAELAHIRCEGLPIPVGALQVRPVR